MNTPSNTFQDEETNTLPMEDADSRESNDSEENDADDEDEQAADALARFNELAQSQLRDAETEQELEELAAVLDFESQRYAETLNPRKRLRRFVNGKKYVLFSDLPAETQQHIRDREEREKQAGLWWDEADKEASKIELRYLRSKVPGDYVWTPQGWKLSRPKAPKLVRQTAQQKSRMGEIRRKAGKKN